MFYPPHHIDSVAYQKCTGVSSRGRRFDGSVVEATEEAAPLSLTSVSFSTGPLLVFAQSEFHDLPCFRPIAE